MRTVTAALLVVAALATPSYAATPPSASVSAPAVVTEGQPALVVVSLDRPSGRDIRVDLDTRRGTALPRSDYRPVHLRVVIPAGTTRLTASVATLNDGRDEAREQFAVQLSHPSHGSLGTGRAEVAIRDTDPEPRVRVLDAQVQEPAVGHQLGFTEIHLSHASDRRIVVEISDKPGTAGPGDYVPLHPTVVFAPGVTRQGVSVEILADGKAESPETMHLAITSASHAVPHGNATITILDAD